MVTDHKLLLSITDNRDYVLYVVSIIYVSIFNPKAAVSTIAAVGMQRWATTRVAIGTIFAPISYHTSHDNRDDAQQAIFTPLIINMPHLSAIEIAHCY